LYRTVQTVLAPKSPGPSRYKSTSSHAGKAGQDSLVINGAIADLVAMTKWEMENVT